MQALALQALTFALLDPVTAQEAVLALQGVDEPEVVEALCCVCVEGEEAAVLAALRSLGQVEDVRAEGALLEALEREEALVRVEAMRALSWRKRREWDRVFLERACHDADWFVRQEAIRALVRADAPVMWDVLSCLTDPVWRVRRDVHRLLMHWEAREPALREELRRRLGAQRDNRSWGIGRFVDFLWGHVSLEEALQEPPYEEEQDRLWDRALRQATWWDDDPPVLWAHLQALSEEELRASLPLFPWLLFQNDGQPTRECSAKIRRFVLASLVRWGDVEHWRACVGLLDEPRLPFVVSSIRELLEALDGEQRERLALAILGDAEESKKGSLLWALQYALCDALEGRWDVLCEGCLVLLGHEDEEVCGAALELWGRREEREAAWPRMQEALKSESVSLQEVVDVWRGRRLAERLGVSWLGEEVGEREALVRLARSQEEGESFSGERCWAVLVEATSWRVRVLCAEALVQAGGHVAERWCRELQRDADFRVRIAALTREHAHVLWEEPAAECWPVLRAAGALLERSLEALRPVLQLSDVRMWQRVRREENLPDVFAIQVPRAASGGIVPFASSGEVETGGPMTRRASARPGEVGLPEGQGAGVVGGLDARQVFAGRLEVMGVPAASGGIVSDTAEGSQEYRGALGRGELGERRLLGDTGLAMVPLVVSGRHGLPGRGFAMALEAGVDAFLWEPAYLTLTDFFQRLSAAEKRRLHVVCGTFASDAREVRRDVEEALRALGIERIGVFVLFWARSMGRLSEEVWECLLDLRAQGVLGTFGFSTHDRALAVAGMREGWEVAMVRHSAAHRGAEHEVFAQAQQTGAGVMTFSNLCYGRLLGALRPTALRTPSAVDCYRYSLSQAGVSVCISAPRDLRELRHNLGVLQSAVMQEEEQRAIRAYGAWVYEENRVFAGCLRGR